MLLHGLAPMQERTQTPCLGAVWVARMTHSKAAAGSKMLAMPSTMLCPSSSRGCPCAPCTVQAPCVPACGRAVGKKAGASVPGTGGGVWQPCTVSGPLSQQCGGGRSRRHSCQQEAVHSPLCGLPWAAQATHPPGRGAYHLHAGVPAGLCPIKAAHPAAPGTVLGEMLGRGPHFPAQVPYSSLRASLWTQAACGRSQRALADITVPTPVTTHSAWLHFHCLSILSSPAAVPGADGPCSCLGSAVAPCSGAA